MKYRRILLVIGLVAVLAGRARAGIFFTKNPKPNPAERVPQLLATLKTDVDENKRASAAKELREVDQKSFPEMISILTDVLKHDPKAAVRSEVVQTLGKLRPISQEAGMALESAIADSSWRVRWEARQALLGYRISGYKSAPKAEEPPHPVPPGGKQNTTSVPASAPVKRGLFSTAPKTTPGLVPNETPPPPLADPVPAKTKSGPIPKAASVPVPTQPPPPSEEGPDLPPGA